MNDGIVDEENGWDEYSANGDYLIHHPGRKELERISELEEEDRLREARIRKEKEEEEEWEWQQEQEAARKKAIFEEFQRQRDEEEDFIRRNRF